MSGKGLTWMMRTQWCYKTRWQSSWCGGKTWRRDSSRKRRALWKGSRVLTEELTLIRPSARKSLTHVRQIEPKITTDTRRSRSYSTLMRYLTVKWIEDMRIWWNEWRQWTNHSMTRLMIIHRNYLTSSKRLRSISTSSMSNYRKIWIILSSSLLKCSTKNRKICKEPSTLSSQESSRSTRMQSRR